jgi:hypothetical protein
MKKFLVSLMVVCAMALTTLAGDLRQVISMTASNAVTTNTVFAGMALRNFATAHLDGFSVGASATATNLTIQQVIVGTSYTNTITVLAASTVASNTHYQLTNKNVVSPNDSLVLTWSGQTNALPTQIYIDYQGY